jgi:hypothetical protein
MACHFTHAPRKHLESAMHDRRNAGIDAGGIVSSDSGRKGAMFLTSFHFKFDSMLLFAGRRVPLRFFDTYWLSSFPLLRLAVKVYVGAAAGVEPVMVCHFTHSP